MFCWRCGNQLGENDKFCAVCGEKVIRDSDNNDQSIQNPEGSSTYEEGVVYSGDVVEQNPTGSENNHDNNTYNNDTYGNNTYGNDTYGNNTYGNNTYGNNVNGSNAYGSNGEKTGWKEYLTEENIERFAPIAALLPVAMAIIVPLLGRILFHVFVLATDLELVYGIMMFIIEAIFIVASAAATGGLVYVVLTKKNPADINAWIVPVVTFLSFLSCLGIAFNWETVSWILGIISVVFGIEFIARILISRMPMESPVNPKAAFQTYQQWFRDYKAKYPTTKDLERAGIEDPENSKFDGAGIELFGYMILTTLVSTVTCGIATPWMICEVTKWKTSHTVINGKRLTFTGSGGSLFGYWILWMILTVITCGIYSLFIHVALRKWELSHTYIEGESIVANGNESYFDGGSFAYLGYEILAGLLLLFTCGLAFPWVMAMLQEWDTRHQVINRRRLIFSGSGLGFLGEYIIIAILSGITCGIYAPWGTVRLNKYIIRHTDFINRTA